jgi:hypothetical protein
VLETFDAGCLVEIPDDTAFAPYEVLDVVWSADRGAAPK